MLELKSTVGQQLTFDIDIQGASEKDVVGKLRITSEKVEYGFDVVIEGGKIQVDIPALDTIVPNLKDGTLLESRLEVVANKEFFTEAWKDQIKVIRPIEVKATVSESAQKAPTVKVIVTEGGAMDKKGKKLHTTPVAKDKKEKETKFPVKPDQTVEERLNKFISKFSK